VLDAQLGSVEALTPEETTHCVAVDTSKSVDYDALADELGRAGSRYTGAAETRSREHTGGKRRR
jgi:hypothetical protein